MLFCCELAHLQKKGASNKKEGRCICWDIRLPPREIAEVSSSMVKGLIGPDGWESIVKKYVPEAVFKKLKEMHCVNQLKQRWLALWQRINAKGDALQIFNKLIAYYKEPHRHYHGIFHVESDAKLIADIDLSSLGTPDEIFDENRRLLRKEYAEVPEELFMQGNSAFLKSLLDGRPSIYSKQFFRDKYEAQACKNISRAIAQLSK